MKLALTLMILLTTSSIGLVRADAQSTPAERGVNSSVVIRALSGTGAGVVISGDRVLTAAHVVGSMRSVVLDSNGRELRGAVLKSDPDLDLAVVHVPGIGVEPLTISDTEPRIGSEVYAIGAPEGVLSISTGIVSSVREVESILYVQTDAAVNPGNSGGPLVNRDAVIVGIVVLKAMDDEGIGYAVAPAEIAAFLASAPAPESVDAVPATRSEESDSAKEANDSRNLAVEIPLAIGALAVLAFTSSTVVRRRRASRPKVVLGRILPPDPGDAYGDH